MDENETKITGIDFIQTEGSSRSTYEVYIIYIQLLSFAQSQTIP